MASRTDAFVSLVTTCPRMVAVPRAVLGVSRCAVTGSAEVARVAITQATRQAARLRRGHRT
jgi:hypothetical protein